ncbi:MAG: FHA domain-containing protein [Rhodothermales bacterium]
MPAHFFCQTGEFAGSSFEIGNEAVIGRGEEAIRLPADVVSGRHARIYFDAERKGYFLEDLQSRNGTKLDGMPVTEPVKLGRLHVVTLADQIDFIYHESAKAAAPKKVAAREAEHTQPAGFVTPVPPPAAPPVTPPPAAQNEADSGTRTQFSPAFTPTPQIGDDESKNDLTIRTQAFGSGPLPTAPEEGAQHTHIGPAYTPTPNIPGVGGGAAPAATPIRYSLQVTKGGRGETHPLMEGENVVGRAANCAVVLDDTSVSRQHAAVTVRGGKVTLQDMGSRNHTFLNGERVVTPVDVPPGAVIRFGVEIEATLRRA